MLLRASCRVISPAEKELTTRSNFLENKYMGYFEEAAELKKEAGLTKKKLCLAFP